MSALVFGSDNLAMEVIIMLIEQRSEFLSHDRIIKCQIR